MNNSEVCCCFFQYLLQSQISDKKKCLKNVQRRKIPDLVNINNYVCFDYQTLSLNNDCILANIVDWETRLFSTCILIELNEQ